MLQTSFRLISTDSSMILTVSMATKSPYKDFLIDTSHISRQSILVEISCDEHGMGLSILLPME